MSDLVIRLEALKRDIDSVKSLSIELKANAKKEEEILRDIIQEIKVLGFDPKTLKQDLETMEKDLESKITEKEKEVLDVKGKLETIERNVRLNETN